MANSWVGSNLTTPPLNQYSDSDLSAPPSAINFQSQLLNAIEQAVIVTDVNGTVVYWNRFAEFLYGWTSPEAINRKIVDLIAPAPMERIEQEFVERPRKAETGTGEFMVRHRNGTEFPVEIIDSPIYDDHQRLAGVVGISHDITERKRIDAELRKSEDKYRTLVEQASDGIHTYDSSGRFLDTNSKLCDMLGYTRDELLLLNVADLIPAEDLSANPIRFDQLLAGETLLKERRLRRKDGTLFYAEISGKLIGPNVIQGMVRDVTRRKRVEESLRHSEERLRTILETSHDGILVEENKRIVFVNRSYLSMFGFDRADELIGRSISEIVAEEDVHRVLAYGRARLDGAEAPSKYEFKGRRRNGTGVDVEASVSLSGSKGSRLITTLVRDIGDRKRFEMLMAVQKGALEMVARGEPLRETLVFLTNAVEVQGEGLIVASILLLDEEGCLRNGASPSLPDDYLMAIDGLKADVNVGTCAAAAASGEMVVTPDIAADPKWKGIAHLPITLGLNAAWSMPIIDGDGNVLGTFGTYFRERREPTDMERQVVEVLARTAALAIEQKEAENNLRDSERQLRLIADAIPLLVSFVDSDRRYRFVNRAYMEWFGVPREEVVGRHLSEVLGEAAYETIVGHVDKALSGETALYDGAVLYRTGKRFISATYIPETDASTGEVVGFHAFVQDVSARKEAEEVLRRSKEELESLVQERTRELENATAERIEMLRQLVNAQEDERQRIARDLHDQLGQQMTVLRLKLGTIHKACDSDDVVQRQIDEVRELARALDSDIGFLAWRSRPAVLDDVGLIAALDQYIERWSAHVDITATFDGSRFGQRRLQPESETAFYRITQEALNNVFKHAGATRVSVFLERKRSEAVLIIEDDGGGFETEQQGSTGGNGMGLTSMRERVGLIGGTLEIESSKGSGTTIYAAVPFVFE